MDNDSLSFGYTEIKLNAVWEGQGGGIGAKLPSVCRGCICLDRLILEYIRSSYLYFRMPKLFYGQKRNSKHKNDKIKLF